MARPFGTYKMSPEAIQTAWKEYTQHCEGFVKHEVSAGKVLAVPKPLIYTIEHFCAYAGIDRDTFNEYGKLPDYSVTIKKIRDEVFARKSRALVNAEGSTTGLIFDMKANYGINEKNLHDVTQKIVVEYVDKKDNPE